MNQNNKKIWLHKAKFLPIAKFLKADILWQLTHITLFLTTMEEEMMTTSFDEMEDEDMEDDDVAMDEEDIDDEDEEDLEDEDEE